MIIETPIRCSEERALKILTGDLAKKSIVTGIEHFQFLAGSAVISITKKADGLLQYEASQCSTEEAINAYRILKDRLEGGDNGED